MRRFLMMVVVIVVGCAMALPAVGDWATPFAEIDNKEGDVAEVHGYVVTAEENENGPFMVIVTTDTMQHVAILASADKGVVPAGRIGRWSIIKAQVVKGPTNGKGAATELKILSVKNTKPAAATQAK